MAGNSCGERLVQLLAAYGVDTVFGIPGNHTVPLYRGLAGSSIRHISPRHEQGAGFMADGYARATGIPFELALIRNHYVGRTFISPAQKVRDMSVRIKFNPVAEILTGKRVVVVDDSIVRGTTSKQIIKLAREAGANKVYFASAAPPVRYPNVYGIDMPAASELIANGREIGEIEKLIGADRLIYQDLNGLIRSVKHDNSTITEFDTSCFSGEYVTGDVTPEYLSELESRRNDAAKQEREARRMGHEVADASHAKSAGTDVGM